MAGNQRRFFDPPTEEERKFWGETASDVMALPSKAASLLQPGWSMLADALTDFLPGQKALGQPLPRPRVNPQTVESPAAAPPTAPPQALAAAITERPPAAPPSVRPETVMPRAKPGSFYHERPMPWRPETLPYSAGEPEVNKIPPMGQDRKAPEISSLRGPETKSFPFMPVDSSFDAVQGDGVPNKKSFSTMAGGDLVGGAEAEMDTARKELGSFSDSAGKWWSVLLAAMFPQYGQALNMMEGFKRNKYMAARDKYNAAMEAAMKEDQLRMRYGPPTVHDLKDGYRMVNGQLMHPERKQYETLVADGPNGPVTKFIEKSPGADTTIDVPSFKTIYGFQSGDTVKAQGVPAHTFNTIYRGDAAADRILLSDAIKDKNRDADQANRIALVERRGDIQRDIKELEAKYRVRWTSGDEQTLHRILSENEQYRDAPPPQQRAMKAAVMEEMMSRKQQGSPATAVGSSAQPQTQRKGAIATIP